MAKTPFNDQKHIPTRPEIDLQLGMLCALTLKNFEHRLEMLSSRVNWSFYWYSPTEGWSYRASYRRKVLCIVHFYKHSFSVTIPVPLKNEREFLGMKELTHAMRLEFERATRSPGSKWVSIRLAGKDDTAPVVAIIRKKMELLEASESEGRSEEEPDEKEGGQK